VATKVKMRSLTLGGALQFESMAQDAVEQFGSGRAQAGRWWWGKVMKGPLLRYFYRWKSPSAHRTTSRIISLTESRIELKFGYILRKLIQDKIFGFGVLMDLVGGELDIMQPRGRVLARSYRSGPAAMAPRPGRRGEPVG
jgi:hypothetical protein